MECKNLPIFSWFVTKTIVMKNSKLQFSECMQNISGPKSFGKFVLIVNGDKSRDSTAKWSKLPQLLTPKAWSLMAKNSSLTVNTTNLSFERLMIGIRTKIVNRKVSRIVEFLSLKFKKKLRGVLSVPFPFWFPFQLHWELVSSRISS